MIYETDYVRVQVAKGFVDWDHGVNVLPLAIIKRLKMDFKNFRIIVETEGMGTHFLIARKQPNTSIPRERKQCEKDLGTAFIWIQKYWDVELREKWKRNRNI